MSLRASLDLSLRAERSNLQGTIVINSGDCFVAARYPFDGSTELAEVFAQGRGFGSSQ